MTGPAAHLVVGSGAAAAAVARTLARRPDQLVTVLDLGGRLEDERRAAVDRMSRREEEAWDPADLALVTARGDARGGRVPQKRSYGSAYPFRDLGQVTGVAGRPADTNREVVSSAYGGFTTVWGAQLMPFARSTVDRWPVRWAELEPHYRAVLQEVPLAAETDDLAELYPLIHPTSGLPPLGPRAEAVLARYDRHRAALRARGVTVGRARLAFRAAACTRCGLCMTGCPHQLIYSAAQTMDAVRRLPNVRYLDGLLVESVRQEGATVVARARDLRTGTHHEFRADRLFLAAGALGTTRLVLGSLPTPPPVVLALESRQFVVPLLSTRPVGDRRRPGGRTFTLNQFNVLFSFDEEGHDSAHLHCYPHNPAVTDGLPWPLRHRAASPVTDQVLRRLTVAFGYLPSWASPGIRVRPGQRSAGGLPELHLDAPAQRQQPPMVRAVLRRLLRAAPALDLWPALSSVTVSGAAKSYHVGGTFPHRAGSVPDGGPAGTDRWGRLTAWDRVHLVDGAVLPSIAATTFTLTVMANAQRIATEVLEGRAPTAGADQRTERMRATLTAPSTVTRPASPNSTS